MKLPFCRPLSGGSLAGAWLLLLTSSLPAHAQQTILSYAFPDATGAPTSTAAGVSGSDFVRDPSDLTFYDTTAGNPAPDANGSGWTTAAQLDPTAYYTFTITPAAGGTHWDTVTLDLANFDAEAIDDGPTQFAVRSSLDGFTADILTGSVGNAFTTDTATVDVTATAPVEYRIYGFGAGTTGGLLQVDNVALPERRGARTLRWGSPADRGHPAGRVRPRPDAPDPCNHSALNHFCSYRRSNLHHRHARRPRPLPPSRRRQPRRPRPHRGRAIQPPRVPAPARPGIPRQLHGSLRR